jgi:hypothetical protein
MGTQNGSVDLCFDVTDAGSMYIGNIGKLIPDYTAVSIHRRQNLKSNINNQKSPSKSIQ